MHSSNRQSGSCHSIFVWDHIQNKQRVHHVMKEHVAQRDSMWANISSMAHKYQTQATQEVTDNPLLVFIVILYIFTCLTCLTNFHHSAQTPTDRM